MEYSGIILAGGKSSRMGQDKATLKLDGLTLVEKLAGNMQPIFKEIIVVTAAPGKINLPGLTEVADTYADAGPLGGIEAGLKAASCPLCMVMACDTPFVLPEDAEIVLAKAAGNLAAVPVLGCKTHGLFGAYHKDALSSLQAFLTAGGHKVGDWLNTLNPVYLTEVDFTPADRKSVV